MKIQILLMYYERPNIVKNALNSIKEMNYEDWELVFLDDGSVVAGEPIVRDILKNSLHKVRFFNTNDILEDKNKRGESHIGLFMNYAIVTSDAEITLILCDDDAITPEYFNNINRFYTENPDKVWAYCHVTGYNPLTQDFHKVSATPNEWLNRYTMPVNPSCALDSSQISWRTRCTKKEGIYLPFPLTCGLDADLFLKMQTKYGPCSFLGSVGQYKAIFSDQMSTRGKIPPKYDSIYVAS